jgi:hydroxymethylpyrimidine pyrophosphatase-like HAD family hydrolase
LFEILPKGVDKGLALKKLADYLEVDVKRTIAVGDYDNDVAMLKAAGCGIAVSNASPSAIEAADVITVSNEEHALAKIIYDIESGRLAL